MLIGLVGKPNVGKSTFFKSMTLMDIGIKNYPFTTIKPNKGLGHVRVECLDKEFNIKCTPRYGYCINNTRFVPVELMDVAGLVPGAHEGKGMGNQFLDDLRQADAFIHVIDISGATNEKGEQVRPGDYNPANDIKFLEEELDYWYLSIIKKNWAKISKKAEQDKDELIKGLADQLSGLKITEEAIKNALKEFENTKWDDNELLKLASKLRITSKPMIIAANKIDRKPGTENLERLKKEFPQYTIIGCSAEVELALKEANNKEIINYTPGSNTFEIIKKDLNEAQINALNFMKEFINKQGSTGIQDVLDTTVFKLLNRIAIFPGGLKGFKDSQGRTLPDCFLLPPKSTALDFAYHIHTDIGDKFVKAIDVRTKKPLGKNAELKHRDIIEIMTN